MTNCNNTVAVNKAVKECKVGEMNHWICMNISHQHDTVGSLNLWVSGIIFPAWSVLYTSTCSCWWIAATRLIIDTLLFLFSLSFIVAVFYSAGQNTPMCAVTPSTNLLFLMPFIVHILCGLQTLSGHNQLSGVIWVPEHLPEGPAAFVRVLHWCRANSYPPPRE